MFEVGQEVLVVDQKPSAEGLIEKVSTWRKVLGLGNDDPCYYVRCEEWRGTARWISGIFVKESANVTDQENTKRD